MSELPEVLAHAAKVLRESYEGHPADVADRANAQPIEGFTGDASHAPQSADRKRIEKTLDTGRIDNDEPVGLLDIAGDLGEKFIGGDADRRDEPQALSDLALDAPADFNRRTEEQLAPRHVDKRFVERERLDDRRKAIQDLANLFGHLGIKIEPGAQHDCVRTKPERGRCGHGAMNAELANGIIRRRHHAAPLGRPPDNERLPHELGPLAFLDRGVEGIHVDVEDHDDSYPELLTRSLYR